MKATVLYNPKCGTCQKVRSGLEAKGYELTLVEYLTTPPTVEELDAICKKLGMEPQEVARKKEPIYEGIAAKTKGRAAWLKALHDNPVLIERPIVVVGDRAIIARPPERLQEL